MVRLLLAAVGAASLLTLSGDAGTQGDSSDGVDANAGVLARFERHRCWLDACPAYRVEVDPDGHVRWDGRSGVAVVGHRAWLLTPVQVAKVRALFRDARFLSLPGNPNCRSATDGSETVTFFRDGRRARTGTRYSGCGSAAADTVRALEERLEALIGDAAYVGASKQPSVPREARWRP